MTDEVQRWSMTPAVDERAAREGAQMERNPKGGWVEYDDYEKLKERLDGVLSDTSDALSDIKTNLEAAIHNIDKEI